MRRFVFIFVIVGVGALIWCSKSLSFSTPDLGRSAGSSALQTTQEFTVDEPAALRTTKALLSAKSRLETLIIPDDLQAMLVLPSNLPYNLRHPSQQYYSQIKQDKCVDAILHGRTNLFVVESGAFDGESMSNSLFFEKNRQSECLLVEANPSLQEIILSKHRKCHLVKGGLSITGGTSTFDFTSGGPLGGITSLLGGVRGRIRQEIQAKKPWMEESKGGGGKVIKVKCFPLHVILQALGRTTIDYWSLDVEGAENAVLSHTDFSKVEVGVMTIEHNGVSAMRKGIRHTMERNNFKFLGGDHQDDYYGNPAYFEKRVIPFPRKMCR